ncbi:MAG: hypothetical protein QNJ46_04095 [Leptolyngbyaceae cyanobacterium MO_188.B28]|nr:hypothetical protein [Leptolyngbyaceae cyanobacterium MO_188.B28]
MIGFVFYIALVSVVLGGGYLLVVNVMGREAASRNMLYLSAWVLMGFAIASFATLLSQWRQVGWSTVYLVGVIGIGLWLLSWPFRKRTAGSLLLNVGRTWQNSLLFWIGVWEVVVAAGVTWGYGLAGGRRP